MSSSKKTATSAALALLLSAPADAATLPSWPDTPVARLEALAVLQTLNADLLSHDSATLTLDRWCATHRMASPARITATRVPAEVAPTPQQRRELRVSDDETVRFRRVRLACGPVVLSEADNWYVPGRLTAEMNRVLDTTDTSFGRAVKALHFSRHTLDAELLWHPLPENWETGDADAARGDAPRADSARGGAVLDIPWHVLEHRAVLSLPDGTPFSEVVERYTGNVLRFPPPPRP